MMECNKDEALRAKEIAEKKMQINDFEGALKIATKAQQLFPQLENINQLLTVCSVHCAAQKMIGSEKDFYGILLLEKLADEVTIKKQYRKLALTLHPDKNKFPGAEAAFKLIGEANVVLLDEKRKALYDSKCRLSLKTAQTKPPPHQVNKNPPASRQFRAQSNNANGFGPQFSSLNHPQAATSNPSVVLEAFWTACPYCTTKFQYLKKFANAVVPCQTCSKNFTAYDLGAQAAPAGFNFGQHGSKGVHPDQAGVRGVSASQPGGQGVPPTTSFNQTPVFPPKDMPRAGSSRMGAPKATGQPVSHPGSQRSGSSKTVRSETVRHVGGKMKTDDKKVNTPSSVADGINEGMSKVDVGKPRESDCGNRGRKRGRKGAVESSESCDTSSSNETDEVVEELDGSVYAAGLDSGVNGINSTRRSSRHRQNVSYNENGSDDDFESPPKKPRKSQTSGNDDVNKPAVSIDNSKTFSTSAEDIKANVKTKGGTNSEGSFPDGISRMGKDKIDADIKGGSVNEFEIMDDSESDGDSVGIADQDVYHCPDPEFTDFDKEREESCFSVDQVWALYDSVDSMPRFYALIKKVFKPGFKLRISWLEADPEDEGEINWANEELPFGCGRFRCGNSDTNSDRLTFSHRVQYEKGTRKSTFVIYPRKGEIWALFKDWDIKWSLDPSSHSKYKYEIVEVVSDFVEDAGIRVAYLDKVGGFVCLFQRVGPSEDSILIPPNQLLRFSHRIPCSKMNGTEKDGVPVGCFELDPASLPVDPDDISYPRKAKRDNGSLESGISGSSRNPECGISPAKSADVKEKNGDNSEAHILRRSPRGVKGNEKKKH